MRALSLSLELRGMTGAAGLSADVLGFLCCGGCADCHNAKEGKYRPASGGSPVLIQVLAKCRDGLPQSRFVIRVTELTYWPSDPSGSPKPS
jgi:hypothetical protein